MARRHNTISLATPDTSILAGVEVPRCPAGCGQFATRCGCPGSPRADEVRLSGRCGVCGYMLATHCTCPDGPRAGLA
jgi:hypothetical protein